MLFYILGYVTGVAGSSLCFKMAALTAGKIAILWFIIGNIIGFACPIAATFGLKVVPTSLFFGLGIGLGFLTLQLSAIFFFKDVLSVAQWSGIVMVGIGAVLLQIK